jgi:lambda family phage portal protein
MGLFKKAAAPAKAPQLKSRAVPTAKAGQQVRYSTEATTPDFAAGGRRSAIFRDYTSGPGYGTLPLIASTRSRVRYAFISNPVAHGMGMKLAAQIVGQGARMFSRCSDKTLRAQLDQAYTDWCEATNFNHTQLMLVRSAIEGGESFGVYYPRNRELDGLPVGMVIRPYESEQLPHDMFLTVANTNRRILAGIEHTAVGDPLFYYFYRSHPGDAPIDYGYNRDKTAILARRVMHVRDPSRPGEIRSLSWFAQSLLRLSEVDAHEDAQSVKQRVSSELTGFFTNKSVGGNENPDFVTIGASTGEEDDAGEDDYFDIQSVEPGTFTELPEGMEVEFAETQDTGPQYQPFIAGQYRAVTSGVGMPYELGTNDYERVKSDRILKIGRSDFHKICKIWQQNMLVGQICRPTWKHMVLTMEAEGQFVRPAGMSDTDLCRVLVQPEGWEYTHPLQDAMTDKLLVRSGAMTRSEWAAKRGTTAEEIDATRAEELLREESAGLVYDSNPRFAGGNGAASKQEELDPVDPAEAEKEPAE